MIAPTPAEILFDEATMRKLNRLALVAERVRAGANKGERRSSRRGASQEFADYRNYTAGDDLRRLDWNAYARLDRPFIKLFQEEEDLAVHLLVDGSRSMDWGATDQNKFHYAIRLAAALGSIVLHGGDTLTTAVFTGRLPAEHFGPYRGVRNLMPLLRFLSNQATSGTVDLNQILRDFTYSSPRPGLVILITDLLSSHGFQAGARTLQSQGHEVNLIHLLAPAELDPPLYGDLRLVDVETGHVQDVTIDRSLRTLYRERLAAWQAEIQAYCRSYAIRYLPTSTAQPWERLILQEMRKAAWVR